MMKDINLFELKEEKEARVSKIKLKGNIRKRLMDIGLTEGSKVKCLIKKGKNGPCAYLIRGAVIVIRKEDAKNILIFDDKEECL